MSSTAKFFSFHRHDFSSASNAKLDQGIECELEATRHALLYLVQPKVTQYRNRGRLGEYCTNWTNSFGHASQALKNKGLTPDFAFSAQSKLKFFEIFWTVNELVQLVQYIYWKTRDDPMARKWFLNMVVVTKICQARSYAKLLTNGEKGKARCRFLGKLDTPGRNGPISGDRVWEKSSASGSWSVGDYTTEYNFTPLLELQSLKPNPKCPSVLKFDCKKGAEVIDFEKTYSKVPGNNWAAGSASAAALVRPELICLPQSL